MLRHGILSDEDWPPPRESYESSYEYREVEWDKDDVWFAHCCCLDDKETKLFASNGIGLAHCPSSNMRLASGIAPIRKMLDTGVNCGIGVDGTSSNDTGNILAETRLAMFLQRSGGDINGQPPLTLAALAETIFTKTIEFITRHLKIPAQSTTVCKNHWGEICKESSGSERIGQAVQGHSLSITLAL